MLAHFSSDMLGRYVQMQRSIVENASFSVRPGGQLVYITCSAYHQENEGMLEYMSGQPGWELAATELIQGWMHGADTMFAARFRKL
jgi:16S rRNA (cytosine967-C5)-methyltransferase